MIKIKRLDTLAKFFFACLWNQMKAKSIRQTEKEQGQYSGILREQAWSMEKRILQ